MANTSTVTQQYQHFLEAKRDAHRTIRLWTAITLAIVYKTVIHPAVHLRYVLAAVQSLKIKTPFVLQTKEHLSSLPQRITASSSVTWSTVTFLTYYMKSTLNTSFQIYARWVVLSPLCQKCFRWSPATDRPAEWLPACLWRVYIFFNYSKIPKTEKCFTNFCMHLKFSRNRMGGHAVH